MGKIRCIGENYVLIPGYFAWSNPILENDEIKEDFERNLIEPVEEIFKNILGTKLK